MTFEAYETSARRGKPTLLFTFTRQSKTWHYTSNARDVTRGGVTYTAAQIKRGAIKQNSEGPQKTLTITLAYQRDPNAAESPATQPLGDNWFPGVPRDPVSVACMATHLSDPDHEVITQWLGVVIQPKFSGAELALTCGPPGSIAGARYQGAKFQVACWKTVYSTGIRGCNLEVGPIDIDGTVTAISGSDVTASEFTQQQRSYAGGTAEWDDASAVYHTANVTGYTGTTITLDDVTGIIVGTVVTAHTPPLWTKTTVATLDGATLTAAALADAPFNLAGGWINWTRAEGIVERRSIASHSGATITLIDIGPELAVGTAITAIPNCPHTWQACLARGNTANFGGAIYKPTQNPFDGQSMSWD